MSTLIAGLSACSFKFDVGTLKTTVNQLTFDQPSVTLTENSSNVISIAMTQTSSSPVIVSLDLSSPTGASLSRLHLSSSTVTIPAGSLSAYITISVDADTSFEGTTSYMLKATNSATGVQISGSQLAISVTDSQRPPILTVANAFASTTASSISFTLTLTPQDPVSVPITVTSSTSDGSAVAGTDFVSSVGTVTFAPGETTKTIDVPLLSRALAVEPKSFQLQLSAPLITSSSVSATGRLISPTTSVTISKALTQADPTKTLPIHFSVVFSQPIDPVSFLASSVSQTGTASGFVWALSSSDNENWDLRATGLGSDGTLVPTLAAGAAVNPLGALTSASTSSSGLVTYDSTQPTVQIEQAAGQPDPTLVFPISFSVVFSERINTSTFTTSSITQAGNAAGVTWSLTNSGDDKTFVLKATSATAWGTIIPKIAAAQVSDLAGNTNLASASTDNQVSFGTVVLPTYGKNGADWTSYVRNDGASINSATDTACDGTETSYRACLHGGELKKVILTGVVSCSGLAMTDHLGLFNWTCDASSGLATFYSSFLASSKGLRDLVMSDGSGFQTNYVTVTGSVSLSTPALNWWPGNPVIALPDNSGGAAPVQILSQAKAVYTLTASRATQGYNVSASGVSIVTLNGSQLRYAGSSTKNCNWTTGLATPTTAICMIAAGSQKNLWFEINANGLPASGTQSNYIYFLANMPNIRIQNSVLVNGQWNAIEIHQVTNSKFINVQSDGLTLVSSNANLLYETAIDRAALSLTDSNNNVMSVMKISNTYSGYALSGTSSGNSLNRLLISNTNGYGMQPNSSTQTKNIIAFATILSSTGAGIGYWNGSQNTFHNLLVANNGNQGIQANGSQTSYSHLALSNNTNCGINIPGTNSKFSGLLLAGNNSTSNCCPSGGSPGINSSCVGTGLSAGLLTPVLGASITIASSFVGKIASDATNTAGATGTVAYPGSFATFDFFSFDNLYSPVLPFNPLRFWSLNSASTYPTSAVRTTWTSGTGRIWDLSLLSTDGAFLNKTDNGVTANAVIVDGASCPSWLGGNVTITDLAGHTFLANAYEIVDDGIGNDNGLCESGEACVAAPNFGAYQGHGDPTSHTCTFSDGTVTGVTMHFAPSNGF